MRKTCVRLGGFVLLSGLFLATGQAADPLTKTSFRNFVAVGDSLVAGFENFSLVAPNRCTASPICWHSRRALT